MAGHQRCKCAKPGLVVLADVGVRTVEQFASRWQAVLLQGQPDLATDGAVAVLRLGPACEPDLPDDGVDVGDYVLDDGRCAGGRVLPEYLSQGSDVGVRQDDGVKFAAVIRPLDSCDLLRQFEDLAEELDRGRRLRQLAVPEARQALGEGNVDPIVARGFKPTPDVGLYRVQGLADGHRCTDGACQLGVRQGELPDGLDSAGIDNDLVQPGPSDADFGDVAVDKLQGLRAKTVPQQRAARARSLHGLIDLGEPSVVATMRVRHRLWIKELPQSLRLQEVPGKRAPRVPSGNAFLSGH